MGNLARFSRSALLGYRRDLTVALRETPAARIKRRQELREEIRQISEELDIRACVSINYAS